MPGCLVIGCERRNAATWEPTSCMMFVSAPQQLKELLYKTWALVPLDASAKPTSNKVYDLAYSPGASEDDFPIGGDSDLVPNTVVAYRWIGQPYRALRDKARDQAIFERIYLSVTPDRVEEMFRMLCVWAAAYGPAVVMIKRSTKRAAGNRPDSIVVYTSDAISTETILAELTKAMRTVAVGQSRPVISNDWFKGAAPAGTRGVGIVGIGIAENPRNSKSFGGLLCDAIGAAIDRHTTHHGPIGALTKLQFACLALSMMKEKGLDPARPWSLNRA